MFQLLQSTEARLLSVTNRLETHGKGKKPGQSFSFKITQPNTLLDMLSPTLRTAIYYAVEEDPQSGLNGVAPSTPLLRTNVVERHTIKGKLEGWQLVVAYGIEDPIVMGSCKVDAFAAECHEGGSIDLYFRVGTSDLDVHGAGIMWSKQGELVFIQVIAPVKKDDDRPAAIDGSMSGGGPGFVTPDDEEGQPARDPNTPDLLGDDDDDGDVGRGATDEFIARNTGGAEAGADTDEVPAE